MKDQKIVVCGGGGFIGGHLVDDLLRKGAKNIVADMNLKDAAFSAVKGMDTVINLACNMGGMGFIENNKGLCMISVLINTHLLMAARELGNQRFFYASSACVYNGD